MHICLSPHNIIQLVSSVRCPCPALTHVGPSPVAEVLGDALRCLASKHIKVAAGRGAADDGEDAAAAVGAAKGRLVSQVRMQSGTA